VLFRLS